MAKAVLFTAPNYHFLLPVVGRGRSVFRAGIRMFSNRKAPAVSKVSGAIVMPVDIYHVLIFNDVPDFSSQNFRIA